MNKSKSRSLSHKRPLKILLFVIGCLLLLAFVIRSVNSDPKNNTAKSDTPSIDSTSQTNFDPPTAEEKKAAEENKSKNLDTNLTPVVTDSNGMRLVTPIVSSADKAGASAYINGIFEEGGICTATYTHGQDIFTTTSSGFQNSNYTSCAPLNLSSPLSIKGDWTLVVSYQSSTSKGSSAIVPIKVN